MQKTMTTSLLNLLALALCYGLMSFRDTVGTIYLEILIFCISIYVLVSAAGKFTELSVTVGNSLGLSKLATGILIIAIGTSAPELFASIGAAIQHQPDMVVGNILGTVVANSLLGIGFGALAAGYPLTVHKDVFGTQMSVFLVAILLAVGGLYDGVLLWFEGIIMVVLLIFYLHHVIQSQKDDGSEIKNSHEDEVSKGVSVTVILFLLINLGALFISGDFVVSSLIESAKILDFSGAKLATTILAVGTSIPEIATAIALVRQNNADSLFGEIIGSNIFDVLGVLGLISLFEPLSMEAGLLGFLAASLFIGFIVVNTVMNDKQINRIEGLSLLSLFVVFTIQLVNI